MNTCNNMIKSRPSDNSPRCEMMLHRILKTRRETELFAASVQRHTMSPFAKSKKKEKKEKE